MSLILPRLREIIRPPRPRLVSPVAGLGWTFDALATGTTNVAAPTGRMPGDLILCIAAGYGANASMNTPTGFTSLGNTAATTTGIGYRVSYRRMASTATGDGNTYQAVLTGGTNVMIMIIAIRDAQIDAAPGIQAVARATGTTPDPSPLSTLPTRRWRGGGLLISGFVGRNTAPGGAVTNVTEWSQNIPSDADRLLGNPTLWPSASATGVIGMQCWNIGNTGPHPFQFNPQPLTIDVSNNYMALTIFVPG